MMLDFTGRVAIVTGAGRGMGRDVALGLARRGAKVVVVDYGGDRDAMTPGSVDVAQAVVDEIVDAGGEAVANGSSVGSGESASRIVNHAMDAFGRVDILVNNAGGGRNTLLHEDSDEQVEAVLRSNFIGPYMLIRRVWPIMQAQKYGRIVNMMSAAILGMATTGAYSAAKAGLIGLGNVAATEGKADGILINGIWPVGNTRLVGALTDDALIEWMKKFPPHLVAEAMIYFCSDQVTSSGEIFSVGGGRVARNAFYNAEGFRDPQLTAESLARNIAAARDMSDSVLLPDVLTDNERFFPVTPVS